jgi:hypothetical protein
LVLACELAELGIVADAERVFLLAKIPAGRRAKREPRKARPP